MIRYLFLLLLGSGCSGGTGPSGTPTSGTRQVPPGTVAQAPSERSRPPTDFRRRESPVEQRYRINGNVARVEGDELLAYTAQGPLWLQLGEEVEGLPPEGLAPGQTWLFTCQAEGDRFLVERVEPKRGLAIYLGTVRELDGEHVVVDGAWGSRRFALLPISDVPPEVRPGSYVGAKIYHLDGVETVLNLRPFPGERQVQARLLTLAPEPLLQTLRGRRTFPGLPVGKFQAGDRLVLHYHPDREGHPQDLRVERLDGPFTFTGKLQSCSARSCTLVDAWGDMLGSVTFRLGRAARPPDEVLEPGDLLEVSFDLQDSSTPLLLSWEPRTLSPIYFGELLQVGPELLRVRTLQGEVEELVVDERTRFAQEVRPGDYADVVYERGHEPPRALLVVKE